MAKVLLQYGYAVEVLLYCSVLLVMWRNGFSAKFRALTALLVLQGLSRLLTLVCLMNREVVGISFQKAIWVYFVSSWCETALGSVLMFMLIYATFWEAMRPLEGLHSMGKVIFRWVVAVSLLFALSTALGPHASGMTAYFTAISRLGDGLSILTLCLLLFVCFAILPLGLTYRSRTFGISLGLGVMTTCELIVSAWFASNTA